MKSDYYVVKFWQKLEQLFFGGVKGRQKTRQRWLLQLGGKNLLNSLPRQLFYLGRFFLRIGCIPPILSYNSGAIHHIIQNRLKQLARQGIEKNSSTWRRLCPGRHACRVLFCPLHRPNALIKIVKDKMLRACCRKGCFQEKCYYGSPPSPLLVDGNDEKDLTPNKPRLLFQNGADIYTSLFEIILPGRVCAVRLRRTLHLGRAGDLTVF